MTTRQIIVHGDCRTLSLADAAQFDVLIADPAYSDNVHRKAVSCTGSGGVLSDARKRDFGFDHLSTDVREWVGLIAGKVKRWSVIYSDIESTHLLRAACGVGGAVYIRTIAWVRWSMPQLSGDRPPSGREDLSIFHGPLLAMEHGEDSEGVANGPVSDLALFYGNAKGRKAWNGPGNLTHLQHKCLRGSGKHPTEKPLDQALDLVSWFSDPGETILDPFAGSGTVGLACAILGRNYAGFETSDVWVPHARKRIAEYLTHGLLSDRDTERLRRWKETTAIEAARPKASPPLTTNTTEHVGN